MKRKSHIVALAAVGLLAIATSAPTFAAGTPGQPDAKFDATIAAYADANILPSSSVPNITIKVDAVNYIDAKAGAIPDYMGIKSDAISSSPGAWTIAKTRGTIDDGSVTLKTALNSGSAQGGGSSVKTMTLAAGSGSSTAAPAIGHSPVELAGLMQTDRTAVITA